jgi:tetratricopeptide (TPR) repeat protein
MRREVVEELAGVFINIQGNWRKALETLDQCPEPFRDAPEIVTLRADCLSRLDRTREAVRLLDDTLRRHPRFPTALLLRAKIYRNEDEPRRALPLLERAVTADGYKEIEMIRQQLAEVYKELGDPLRAAEQHRLYEEERGLREDQGNWTQEAINRPWDDRIRYQLGLLTLKLSQPREAAMWFKAAVMANPDNHLARQALAGLGTGPAASRGSGAGGSD